MKLIGYWLAVLALCSSTPSIADSNTVRIGGGNNTGEYIHIARAICSALGKFFSCQALETGGSLDNIRMLENQDLEFGLAMINVVDEWLRNPAIASKYTIVRTISGEAILAFGKPETIAAVGSWLGVRENATLMSIGIAGKFSGDASILTTLQKIPGSPLANLKVKTYQDRLALLEAVRTGDVKLGFLVQLPNPDNIIFKAINDAGLEFMGVVDPDMIAFNEVYPIKSVTVRNASWFGLQGRAQRVETANVPIAIVAIRPEALDGRPAMVQKSAIKQIWRAEEGKLLPKQNWIQNLTNTATIAVGADLDKIFGRMRSSA